MELVCAAHAADMSGWARPVAFTVRRPLVQNMSTALFCSGGVGVVTAFCPGCAQTIQRGFLPREGAASGEMQMYDKEDVNLFCRVCSPS